MRKAKGLFRALAAILAGTVNAPAFAVPVSEESRLEWSDCAVGAPDGATRCGRLHVPENWKNPERGRRVILPFVVLKAQAEHAQPDPVVFLTGGPGVSPLHYLNLLARMPFRARRDIIVIEPRGHGYAEPALLCDNDPAALALCYRQTVANGIDPGQYNTAAFNRDLDALRAGLDIETWNLLGVSYGTFWALHYLREYPQHVRSLLLDSPYPSEAGYDWSRVSALNALDRVLDSCAANAACDGAYPDLRRRFTRAVTRMTGPRASKASHARGIASMRHVYGKLYDSATLPLVPALLDAIARADAARIDELTAASTESAAYPFEEARAHAWGLNAAVMCADDIFFPAAKNARVAGAAKWPNSLAAALRPEGWDYDARCRAWPVPRSAATWNAPVASDKPALVLVGVFDPITPPEFGAVTARNLPNARLFVASNASHAVLTAASACLMAQITGFFDDPMARPNIDCAPAQGRPQWILPSTPSADGGR